MFIINMSPQPAIKKNAFKKNQNKQKTLTWPVTIIVTQSILIIILLVHIINNAA